MKPPSQVIFPSAVEVREHLRFSDEAAAILPRGEKAWAFRDTRYSYIIVRQNGCDGAWQTTFRIDHAPAAEPNREEEHDA